MMTGTNQAPCTITLARSLHDEALLRRVRGEYREMPGMRLSVDQAMRLFMLDRRTCSGVLDSLVAARFLEQDRTGRYLKSHCGY